MNYEKYILLLLNYAVQCFFLPIYRDNMFIYISKLYVLLYGKFPEPFVLFELFYSRTIDIHFSIYNIKPCLLLHFISGSQQGRVRE